MAVASAQKKEITDFDFQQFYPLSEALEIVRKSAHAKFDETVEVALSLGVDPRKSDQQMRLACVLPHGLGKQVRVAVFAEGDAAKEAESLGADRVGMQDLADDMKQGNLNYDVVIAAKSTMPLLASLGKVLGPKGLMPNPKVGTVTPDVETAVKNAKAGQVRFRTDKNGIVHGGIGKIGFDDTAVKSNLEALLADLKKAKPASAKGVYIKKIVLSSTLGPGLQIDQASLTL